MSINSKIDELYEAAQVAIFASRYEHAHKCLMEIIRYDSNFADAYFLLARIANTFKNYDKEIGLLHKAIDIDSENAEYFAHLSKAYAIKGDVKKAYEFISRACHFESDDSLTLDTIGVVFNRLNMYKEASEYFQKAVVNNKTNCGIYFNLGATLKFCGDFSGARDAFERAISLCPDYYKAHAALTSLGKLTAENNHIDRLQSLLSNINNSDDLLHICHALSKEYEALDNYDKAYVFLERGKQSKLESFKYDIEKDKATFFALKKHFSDIKPIVSTEPDLLGQSTIFVVGMPRSGTTLVERIVSNHSRVATAGELPNFGTIAKALTGSKSTSLIDEDLIEKSTGLDYKSLGNLYLESTAHLKNEHEFLVDKLPLNVLYAGHIIRALPKAKIICLDRNPLDTILSNYRQLFSFSDMTYGYSLSLTTATQYYIEFKKLIEFWKSIFPDNFYVVNYEMLVKDSAAEARKVIEFCNLPWEENCLSIEKNNNPVATASSVQVRGPISDKSVGQWKHYELYVEDVKRLLSDGGLLNI